VERGPHATRALVSGADAPAYVGCAGWSLPRAEQHRFPEEGTHLARYAQRLNAVEINSSFYRPHRTATYARWAASVPASFRFSVKVPRAITHDRRLVDAEPLLDAFLAECAGLGEKLGCLLVQLPPSLDFRVRDVEAFHAALRARYQGAVVTEPRHVSWFGDEADAMLREARVGRVAADPVRAPGADEPGGWPAVEYHRLHGSPRIYYSDYDDAYLAALHARMRAGMAAGRTVWCIFDNTAAGAATANALDVTSMLRADAR
jgi:uncharacterized protein YecE (DUF72 family)